MKKTYLKRLLQYFLILAVALNGFLLQAAPVYGETFAYGIQLAAFEKESDAMSYAQMHKNTLGKAYVYSGSWSKVYYGIYASEGQAKAQLPKARAISKDAFISALDESVRANLKPAFSLMEDQIQLEASSEAPTKANAATAKPIGLKQEVFNQTLSNDLITNGVFGVSVIAFNLSDDWIVKEGSYISLNFSHALPMKGLDSSVTLLVNNRPVYSEFLTEAGVKGKTLKIPISKEWISSGYNELKVKSYLRLTEDLCETDNNPASWFLISKKSFLHIEYEEQMDTTQIVEYPYPYVKSGEEQPIQFSFLYEEEGIQSKAVEAMYVLASDLGRSLKGKSLTFDFSPVTEREEDKSYIFIGDHIPKGLESYWPEKLDLSPDELVIAEVPHGTGKLLFIISKKAANLPALTRNLNERAVIEQLTEQVVHFDERDLREADLKAVEHEIVFEEVGYGPMTIEGSSSGTMNYFLDIPNNWDLKAGTELVLQTRFSSLIDAAKSSVALSINGIPVGSKSLNPELKDDQILRFALPEDALQTHRLSLSLTFYLSGDFDCSSISSNKGIWIYVSNQSYLDAVYDQKKNFVLEDLPNPFVVDQRFNQLELVLSKSPDEAALALGASIMGKFGQETKSSSEFSVSFGTPAAEKNHIYIGSPSEDHIQWLNDKLLIGYEPDFKSYKPNAKFYILSSHQQEYSSVQLIKDPEKGHADLVVASFAPEGLEWVGKYIYDLELSERLQGQGAVVSRSGQVQTVALSDSEDQQSKLSTVIKNNEMPKATFENIRNFLVFIVIILMLITLLVVLLTRRKFKS